jgi:prepilin-type processing-associated H-X9-DG protein
MMVGEVADGHIFDGSNIWSRNVRLYDNCRTTDNPLNTFPGEPQADAGRNAAFSCRHPSGCHFLFADGHVSFLPETIDENVYLALATREKGDFTGEY